MLDNESREMARRTNWCWYIRVYRPVQVTVMGRSSTGDL